MFQHTAARRRLGRPNPASPDFLRVSTHSRPKAAGSAIWSVRITISSFNTQPPEGGWASRCFPTLPAICFNTQPPEGGWFYDQPASGYEQRFNTQPPEGGWKRNSRL